MLLVPDETRQRLRAERDRFPLTRAHVLDVLRKAGLRPTRQRVALGGLLFREHHRHVTADGLHQEALGSGVTLSLATVYNALHQFAEAGLLRQISVDGERTYFDTDTGNHHHFYIEAERRILDVPPGQVRIGRLPEPPAGYEIAKVDVVIRLKRRNANAGHACSGPAAPGCRQCGACRRGEPE